MKLRAWSVYLAQRLLGTFIVLVILSIGIFALLYLAPGSVEQTLLGTRPVNASNIAAVRAQYHLDESFFMQYFYWLKDVLSGDLGTSIRSGTPVTEAIGSRIGLTVGVTVFGSVLALLIGVPLGILGALKEGTATDRAVVAGSVAAMSAPPFAVGLVLLWAFAVQLGWFPVYGLGEGVAGRIWHLTLPALALAVGGVGLLTRFTRAAMVRELNQDYIVFVRSRGLGTGTVVREALRNSWVAILTATGLIVTSTLVATVLVEVIFALPGLGNLLVDAVTFKDVPVVQALALLLTLLIAVINLVVDISYSLVDPRIRLGASG